jgi:hypothetical protein
MRKLFILSFVALILNACSAKYVVQSKLPLAMLDPAQGVLIAIPEDGGYYQKTYPNSGKVTAQEIRRIITMHTGKTTRTECNNFSCLQAD